MKKSYYKSIPFLIFALIINAFATLLESYLLIRMAALFDLCIQGDMTALHRQLPVSFALIAMLLPIGVAIMIRHTTKRSLSLTKSPRRNTPRAGTRVSLIREKTHSLKSLNISFKSI